MLLQDRGTSSGSHLGDWETVLSLLPDDLTKALESSIQETQPDNDAIKAAVAKNEIVPGAEVRRGLHVRVV
jgi:hypothetical protein